MEKARMLGTEQVVVGGTEGGRSPTGVHQRNFIKIFFYTLRMVIVVYWKT
jgi:hypothetical protein